jgi:tetratricopeptide (TPR) repeat protein
MSRWSARAVAVAIAAVCGCGGERAPTFSGGVAEILHANCSVCHRPGGSAPFSLLTYEEAREHARRIATMTGSGEMPPWPPHRPEHVFIGERGLSTEDVALLADWASAGAPLGDASEVPAPPEWPEGWHLGTPDLVLSAETSFTVPPDAPELFRNFVLPVPLASPRWVRAVELDPGSARVVHHATLALDRTPASRELDAGHMPAGGPDTLASAMWRLRPGSDLIVRLHLRPIDEAVTLTPRVALYFSDSPPERTPVAVQLGAQWMDIPAGEADYVVEDSFRLPVAVDVMSVYPHAHYLADTVQAWAETPAGERLWLIDIPDWDFDWQDEYRFVDPVGLPAGSTLRMRYTFDNTSANRQNPSDPPVRVTYGPRSIDEMADLIVQTMPRARVAASELQAAAERKVAEIKLGGYAMALARGGDDARLRYNIGIAEAAVGRLAEAEAAFRSAARLDPTLPEAFVNLGIVLHRQDRVSEAATAYERALTLEPTHASAHHNLSIALAELGRGAESERHARLAVASDSTFAAAHKHLARLERARGDLAGAVESYRRSLENEPDDVEARLELGSALAQSGDGLGALESYRSASALAPDAPAALLAMADLLAGYPNAAVRQPVEAVRLARRAVELTRRADPVALFSLANALAAAGSMADAISTAEEALAGARQVGNAALARAIEARLTRYREGRP